LLLELEFGLGLWLIELRTTAREPMQLRIVAVVMLFPLELIFCYINLFSASLQPPFLFEPCKASWEIGESQQQ